MPLLPSVDLKQRPRRGRGGFSLVEALVAVSITTIAGGALLAALGGAVYSSTEAAHIAVARGLADQLMDEIAAVKFPTGGIPNPTQPTGTARETFDDIDDYGQWSRRPPVTREGIELGTDDLSGETRPSELHADTQFLNRFTRRVQVERVQPDDGDSGWRVVSGNTNFRRVTVRVDYTDAQDNTRTLVEVSRIFSYVPNAP